MNPLIGMMLVFFVIGAIDRIIGNRFELGVELEKGISQMGAYALSIVGFYCIGVSAIQNHMSDIVRVARMLPFDISMVPGVLLAADMGGLPMAMQLSEGQIGLFSGLLLSSGIGCLLSFQLPVALSIVERENMGEMMQGLVPGIIAMPTGLIVGGLMLGIPIPTLIFQMIPILILCVLMIIGFIRIPVLMQKILTAFGMLIKGLGTLLFGIVMLGLFWEPMRFVDSAMVEESLIIVIKICVVVCGALVFSRLVLRYASRFLQVIADRLGVNLQSVIGLMLNFVSGAAMLPMFSQMDRKGKLMNSAFSVMGAYVFGGQMGFVAGLVTGQQLAVYMVGKLVAGIFAILLVSFQVRKEEQVIDKIMELDS